MTFDSHENRPKRPLRSVLEAFSPGEGNERGRIPVPMTADGYKVLVESVSHRSANVRRLLTMEGGGIEYLLEEVLLSCVDGDFLSAEKKVFTAFAESIDVCTINGGLFRKFLTAFFMVRRLDVVRELINIRYSVPFLFELAIEQDGPGLGRLRWEIDTSGRHKFVFDSEVHGPYPMEIFCQEFPLFINYALSPEIETGSVIHNQWDMGRCPGLAYSDSRPDYFLVPDHAFVGTGGYEYERHYFQSNIVNWDDKIPIAFWRGSTTGHCNPGQWRELERIRLCEIAREGHQASLFDVGISGIVQMNDPESVRQIEASGLLSERVPWEQWGRYKYHIDIDGNASAWSSMFQKLFTGSPVLKVESARGFRQWYYDELIPWHNYIPIAPSMWDLADKVRWLQVNDSVAREIGERGRDLAHKLTYAHEMARSVPVISAAFRYFRKNSKFIDINPRSELELFVDFLNEHGFDFAEYTRKNGDLAHFKDTSEAAAHLILYGLKEGRQVPVLHLTDLAENMSHLNVSSELKDLLFLSVANFQQASI